jgi:hypothetical protein
MSIDVTAVDGDTLCGIAISAGFLNCAPLRAEAANQPLLSRPLVAGDKVTVPDLNLKELSKSVDAKHVFRKKNAPPVSVRFVHGSPDKKYLEDDSLSVLHVSNFVTNKAGVDGSKAFPKGFGFNPDGHADPDTFKVEIVDPGASGSVKAQLEALKPVKQADGSILFQPISGVPDAGLRKIDALTVKQVNTGHVAFRSTYMRLVVDAEDHAAAAGQTLLTTDTVDAGDEALEILDQHVRATYEFGRCPGSPKCKVTAELGIGDPIIRAKVAVHILIDPASGNPVSTIDQTRKSVLKYVRQLYAQASMSVKLVDAVRTVPAPTNLIAIANGNGAVAAGGTIRIRVRVGRLKAATFDFDQEVQIVTTAGTPPLTTATALAAAINAAFGAASPPFAATATPSDNPPLRNQALGSADVVVGNALSQRVSLTIVTNGDVGHRVTIGEILTTRIVDFGLNDSHVGTIDERTLVKNYDTGTDRIDLFVIGQFSSGALGEAFHPHANQPTARQPLALMTNTGLFRADTVNIKDHFHTTIPHELGHILMDENHEIVRTEMMVQGDRSLVKANERLVNAPKRISDPPAPRTNEFDTGTRANPVTLLRTANTQVTE